MKGDQDHQCTISICCLTTLLLIGCHQEQQEQQLRHWLAQNRYESVLSASPPEQLTALPQEQEFHATPYLLNDTASPFGERRSDQASPFIDDQNQRPPQRAAPQLLENFSLDSIRMVGSLIRADQRHAVIKVADTLYQVSPGDYLGQQFGKIEHILEDAIVLEELVRDATGVWTAHSTRLLMEDNP